MKTNNSLLFCYNCYNTGHISKKCPHTVLSYGIICFRASKFSHDHEFLMVERKYSFAFVDFLMGKYDLLKPHYLQTLFNRMTLLERCLLASNYTFKKLWHKVWNIKDYKKSIQKEFCKSSIKFYILRNGFISVTDNKFYSIETLIQNSTSGYKTPQWYFPKGKRSNEFEKPMDCAIREFKEETNLEINKCKLIKNICFEEEHVANNLFKKKYKVCFFLAEYINDEHNNDRENHSKTQFIDSNNEIGNIEWLNFNECLLKFRKYEKEKIELMEKIKLYFR